MSRLNLSEKTVQEWMDKMLRQRQQELQDLEDPTKNQAKDKKATIQETVKAGLEKTGRLGPTGTEEERAALARKKEAHLTEAISGVERAVNQNRVEARAMQHDGTRRNDARAAPYKTVVADKARELNALERVAKTYKKEKEKLEDEARALGEDKVKQEAAADELKKAKEELERQAAGLTAGEAKNQKLAEAAAKERERLVKEAAAVEAERQRQLKLTAALAKQGDVDAQKRLVDAKEAEKKEAEKKTKALGDIHNAAGQADLAALAAASAQKAVDLAEATRKQAERVKTAAELAVNSLPPTAEAKVSAANQAALERATAGLAVCEKEKADRIREKAAKDEAKVAADAALVAAVVAAKEPAIWVDTPYKTNAVACNTFLDDFKTDAVAAAGQDLADRKLKYDALIRQLDTEADKVAKAKQDTLPVPRKSALSAKDLENPRAGLNAAELEQVAHEAFEVVARAQGLTTPQGDLWLAHFMSRHGPQTRPEDQVNRVVTGVPPDKRKPGEATLAVETADGATVPVTATTTAGNDPSNAGSRIASGAAAAYMLEDGLAQAWLRHEMKADQDKFAVVAGGEDEWLGEKRPRFDEPGGLGESYFIPNPPKPATGTPVTPSPLDPLKKGQTGLTPETLQARGKAVKKTANIATAAVVLSRAKDPRQFKGFDPVTMFPLADFSAGADAEDEEEEGEKDEVVAPQPVDPRKQQREADQKKIADADKAHKDARQRETEQRQRIADMQAELGTIRAAAAAGVSAAGVSAAAFESMERLANESTAAVEAAKAPKAAMDAAQKSVREANGALGALRKQGVQADAPTFVEAERKKTEAIRAADDRKREWEGFNQRIAIANSAMSKQMIKMSEDFPDPNPPDEEYDDGKYHPKIQEYYDSFTKLPAANEQLRRMAEDTKARGREFDATLAELPEADPEKVRERELEKVTDELTEALAATRSEAGTPKEKVDAAAKKWTDGLTDLAADLRKPNAGLAKVDKFLVDKKAALSVEKARLLPTPPTDPTELKKVQAAIAKLEAEIKRVEKGRPQLQLQADAGRDIGLAEVAVAQEHLEVAKLQALQKNFPAAVSAKDLEIAAARRDHTQAKLALTQATAEAAAVAQRATPRLVEIARDLERNAADIVKEELVMGSPSAAPTAEHRRLQQVKAGLLKAKANLEKRQRLADDKVRAATTEEQAKKRAFDALTTPTGSTST